MPYGFSAKAWGLKERPPKHYQRLELQKSTVEQFHRNDMESMAAWIEHKRNGAMDTDLVKRFVKFQGDTSTSGLSEDDFILIRISEPQVDVLKKFCRPYQVVVLDSTQGTNGYHFQLTTTVMAWRKLSRNN